MEIDFNWVRFVWPTASNLDSRLRGNDRDGHGPVFVCFADYDAASGAGWIRQAHHVRLCHKVIGGNFIAIVHYR